MSHSQPKKKPAEEWMCTIYHKNDPLRDQLEPLYRYQLLTGEESKDAEYGKSMFIGEKDCQVLLSVEGMLFKLPIHVGINCC
jgi:hypothetical protein